LTVLIGEAREQWAADVWAKAEDFANNMKQEEKPFYIVYACKQDKSHPDRFFQAIKAYYQRPTPLLGILVWYVNNPRGIFEFVPELSAPPDIPVDPNLLSDKSEDMSARVASQGEKLNVLLS